MKRLRALAGVLVVAVLAYAGWSALDTGAAPRTLSGYVEGEASYFAAPNAAPLADLPHGAGTRVAAGETLFALDAASADAELAQARAALAAARAHLEDARSGQRPEELAVLEAQRDAAQARRDDAQAEFDRVDALVASGSLPQARRDQARTALETAQADLSQIERRIAVARMGAPAAQIAALEAQVTQAQASVEQARIARQRLAPLAPAAGVIEDVYFREGEWVAPNQPVLSLLPDGAVIIRFFVPEAELTAYAPGKSVAFSCDGCGVMREATITEVATRAEYTPPVIYSRDSRQKLVFRIEARPSSPEGLAPGLPVDVVPLGG